MKIVHVITGLNNGGAEGVLFRLCTHDKKNQHIVISMMDHGKYGPLLLDNDVQVYSLNMPRGKLTFKGIKQLYSLIKIQKPDIVQTWMSHADLVGGLIAKIAGVKKVFWNVRHSDLDSKKSSKKTLAVIRFCSYLSNYIPHKIICCAYKAYDVCLNAGYPKDKMIVISNGYDLSSLGFDLEGAEKIKEELKIYSDLFLIGMVARYDPAKNHLGLIEAFKRVNDLYPDTRLILVGRDVNDENLELSALIKKLNIHNKVYLLDQRTDINSIMSMLDVHVLSSSFGEGFPNVLAEAMAASTPCVTTDVGDAAVIVSNKGWVVPIDDTIGLSDGFIKAYNLKNSDNWIELKNSCRVHISENFCIKEMVKKYNSTWNL